MLTMLRAKIHRATVTETHINYEGSLALDADLIKASGIHIFERVEVANLNTGDRFATYVVEAPAGSGTVALYGGAARLGQPGDRIIIFAYALVPGDEAVGHEPRVVLVDEKNKVRGVRP